METEIRNSYGMPVLISKQEIEKKVSELAELINQDYRGREISIIGTLKGCFVFTADLLRNLRVPVKVDFIEVSSYGHEKTSSGVVRINKDIQGSLENEHVLLIEDIVDTGHTLNYLLDYLRLRRPASLKVISLLLKEKKQRLKKPIDYFGFAIEDQFVVGYGMDFRGRFRELDHIALLEEENQDSLFF